VLKVISVRNNARVGVIRANMMFPAGRTYTFVMDPSVSKFKEIKACASLEVVGMEDFVESVYKIEVGLSAVEEPVVVTKLEEPVVEEPAVEEPVAEEPVIEEFVVPTPPPPEPVVDTTPLVVEPESPADNVAELEVLEPVEVYSEPELVELVEVVEEPEVMIFSCPYCDFEATKKVGALNHVRSKHLDNYAEYKERLGNV